MTNKKKWGLALLFCLIGAISITIAMLPTIFSTHWGTQQLARIINRKIPGKVTIQSASLSWSGPQLLEGVDLNDPTCKPVVHIKKITSESSLLGLIQDGIRSGKTEVQGLNISIIEDRPGQTNLHYALGDTYLPYRFDHAAKNPLLISLDNVDANIIFPVDSEWPIASAQGQTQFGNVMGGFSVESLANGTMKMQLSHFPVALIDHIACMKDQKFAGIPNAALGDLLDLSVTRTLVNAKDNKKNNPENHSNKKLHFEIIAKSPNLSANFSGELINQTIILDHVANANFNITPEFISLIGMHYGSQLPLELQQPAATVLTIEKLMLPLAFFAHKDSGENSDVAVIAHFSLPQADLIGSPQVGSVVLRDVQASLQAKEGDKIATLQVQGQAMQQGHPLQVKIDATIDKPSSINNLAETIRKQLNIRAAAKGVPVALAEHISELELTADLQGSLENKAHLVISGDVKPNQQSVLAIALGESAQIHIETTIEELVGWRPINLNISSQTLKGKLQGEVHEGHKFVLTSPANFDYTMTPQAFEKLGSVDHQLLSLRKNVPVQLTVNKMRAPLLLEELAAGDLSSLQLSGQVQAKELIFSSSSHDDILVQSLILPWEIDARNNRIQLNLDGRTQLARDAAGTLDGKIVITNWLKDNAPNFSTAAVNAKVRLGKLPVILFAAMSSGQGEILNLLGTSLDVDLDAHIQSLATREGTVEIALQGDQLLGNIGIKIDESITLSDASQPIVLRAKLSPERFNSLRKILVKTFADNDKNDHLTKTNGSNAITLLEPTNITATISSMRIPLHGASAYIPHEFIADLVIDELKLKRPFEHHSVSLAQLSAHFDSQDMAKKMAFRFEGLDRSISGPPNPFFCAGDIENFFTDAGAINVEDLSLSLEAKSNRLPASLFCQLVCLKKETREKLEALLGETVDTDIKAKLQRMNGPIQATLKGKNGNLKLDAQLDNGVLRLNQPFVVEVAVTPKLGKSILEEVIPILSGVISGDRPVKITVQPKGFALPLYPAFSLDKIQMELATVELGKMTFNREGDLGNVFDVLRPSNKDILSVWFTPLYISMQKGVLRLARMDMLMMDRDPLALWGKVDTVKDRVDLRIGITGLALAHALKEDNIPKDAMMQIPLTGTMSDNSIDKTKAAARISALVAQSQGSAHGLLIGAFLDIAGGNLSEEKPPEPTTNPLPWAHLLKEGNKEEDNVKSDKAEKGDRKADKIDRVIKEDRKEDKKEDKSDKKKKGEKQLEKAASSLINNLFR